MKGKGVSKQSFCSILYKFPGCNRGATWNLEDLQMIAGHRSHNTAFQHRTSYDFWAPCNFRDRLNGKENSSDKRQVGWRSFTVLFHSWHCCVLAHILSTIFASAGGFFCFVKSCVQFVYQLLGRCAKRKEGLVRSHSPACLPSREWFRKFSCYGNVLGRLFIPQLHQNCGFNAMIIVHAVLDPQVIL